MIDDPRKAKTLGEACQNADGSYNGLRLLSWLSEIVAPGHGVPVEEVAEIAEKVKARRHG